MGIDFEGQKRFNFYDENEFNIDGSTEEAVVISNSDASMVIVVYQSTIADIGKVKLATIDGTTIVSFGSGVQFSTAAISHISAAFLSESEFVVAYRDNADGNHGKAQFGTISGTTITFGPQSTFNAGSSDSVKVGALSESGFVVGYRDFADSSHATAKIGTISGSTISFGVETEFAASTNFISFEGFSESGFIVAYRDGGDAQHGTAKFGTVSGTTITFGNESEFLATNTTRIDTTRIDSSGFVVAYRDETGANSGLGNYGRVSGTDIFFSPKQKFINSNINFLSVATLDASTVVVVYDLDLNSQGQSTVGKISGITLTWESRTAFGGGNVGTYINPGPGNVPDIAPLGSSRFIVIYEDDTDSDHGTARIGTLPVWNSANLFIKSTTAIETSGELFIHGLNSIESSGNLFICGHESVEASGNLFILGKDNLYCLYPDNVVFYHPADDYREDTNQLPWNENVVAFSGGIIVSGITITANGHTALTYDNQIGPYPSLSGATSIALAYWGKDFFRTGPDAELFAGNSSDPNDFILDNGLHLHGNNGKPAIHINGVEYIATAALSPLPNDGEWHFVILYAEISGGQWRIYGSVDGNDLNLLGSLATAEPLSDQRYLIVNLDDSNEAIPAPITDEIILWTGLTAPFTPQEVISLDNLARIHGARMDQNVGHFEYADNSTLFTYGRTSHAASGDLFQNGHEVIQSSGDLFVKGHEQQTTSTNLYINGYDNISGSINTFIEGIIFSSTSGNLYITAYDIISGSTDIFIEGNKLASESSILYTHSHITEYSSGTLNISGPILNSSSGDLFIIGNIVDSVSGNLIIFGQDTIETSGDLFLCVADSSNDYSDLIINGHQPTSGEIPYYTLGVDSMSESGNLFVSGCCEAPKDKNLDLFINGFQPKPAVVCPILDPTASIQIKDSLIRIYQSRIDALINQLGKNVYLEFDPIRDPCPNCKFDTIRNRSTGIYIPGGPRPFKRGRRCPYCKGHGFTKTPVNKCIKCLIKWNPKDAENYGISISDKKGIVRFKTYLTESDDLTRARTAISNHDIVGQMSLRVKLISGPIPVGLREDRYCISFWELI